MYHPIGSLVLVRNLYGLPDLTCIVLGIGLYAYDRSCEETFFYSGFCLDTNSEYFFYESDIVCVLAEATEKQQIIEPRKSDRFI